MKISREEIIHDKVKKKIPTVRKKTKILNFSFQQVKIAHNSHFIPSQLEAGFRKWEGNSSILLDQLFEEAEDLVFFEQLQHKYDHLPHYFAALEKDKKWDKLHAVPLKYEAICYVKPLIPPTPSKPLSHQNL